MRISKLHLRAFGPFTDACLDLDASGPALHVIYGDNAAGKSTTLRALFGLFFGIPRNTVDAHLHRMQKLRIGAQLIAEDGAILEVIRKKGNKNTLLDSEEIPIDGAQLDQLLAHIGADRFNTTFGLDHTTLRKGAEDLLASGGDVGESLFGASFGGEIHGTLSALDGEANAIFVARGSKPELNAALAEHREAQKKQGEAGFSPEIHRDRVAALEQAQRELEQVEADRLALRAEKGRIQRALRVMPRLSKLATLRHDRVKLGELPRIDEHAIKARETAQEIISEGESELTTLRSVVKRLEDKREGLPEIGSLAKLQDETLSALSDRLGAYRSAQTDLPRRGADRDNAMSEATRIAQRVRPGASVEEVRTLLLSAADRAAIEDLGNRFGELVSKVRDTKERLEADEAGVARPDEVSESQSERDSSALSSAVDRARELGDASAELAALDAEAASREAAAERLAQALPGFEGGAEAAARLAVPSRETVERDAEQHRRFELTLENRRTTEEQAKAKLEQIELEIIANGREGELPTEEQLEAQRQARDRLWTTLRRAMERDESNTRGGSEQGVGAPDPDGYERAVSRADATADHLRRDADRVARRARLGKDRVMAEHASASARAQVEDASAKLAAHDEATRTRWKGVGVNAMDAADRRPWSSRHSELVQAYAKFEELRSKRAALAARIEEVSASLIEVLADQPPRGDFDELKREGKRALDEALERRSVRRSEDEQRKRTEDSLARLRLQLISRERELDEWRGNWASRVSPLGLGVGAMPSEVLAMVRVLDEFDHQLERIDSEAQRIAKMERDAEHFEAEIDDLVSKHAPELAELALDERASALIERIRHAHQTQAKRRELARDLAEPLDAIGKFEDQIKGAHETLSGLCQALGVADLDALIDLEERATTARDMDEKIAKTSEELREEGDGKPFEELEAETRDLEIEQVRGRDTDIDREFEELDTKWKDAVDGVTARKQSIQQLEKNTSVAHAANETAAALAKVQSAAHRYVRLRLAATILRAEIARYRDENQGPILEQANRFFPRLTLGTYRGLRAGFDDGDAPILRCIRADGEEIGVEGLSEGTKDQLYLSLRLASLMRFAEHTTPLPLILDDCLVHFDDARARAALEVLGEVSSSFQILFFTHHAKLLELAQEAVPEERLHICTLDHLKPS